jgi:hypothetical protein
MDRVVLRWAAVGEKRPIILLGLESVKLALEAAEPYL